MKVIGRDEAVRSAKTDTVVPLVRDPMYRESAMRFIREAARKYDGDPAVPSVDATPGAETNPYRMLRMDRADPEFRGRFLAAARPSENSGGWILAPARSRC